MKRNEILLPAIPEYFTIGLYKQGPNYVAHELQSNLWCRDMMMLSALQALSKQLIGIQLEAERAEKRGIKVKRLPESPANDKTIEMIRRTGIILRNVVLEP